MKPADAAVIGKLQKISTSNLYMLCIRSLLPLRGKPTRSKEKRWYSWMIQIPIGGWLG